MRRSVLAGWLLLAAGAAPALEPAAPLSGPALWLGSWRLETWGHEEGGSYCLVRDGGAIRLELGRVPGLDRLWNQHGEGWTLVLGPGGQGTLNAWGREWRTVEPAQAGLAEALAAELAAPGSGRPGPGEGLRSIARPAVLPPAAPSAAAAAGTRRAILPAGAPAGPGRFRADLVARGSGQGGGGEIVTLTRRPGSPPVLRLRSSRRPGHLDLVLEAEARPLPSPPPELFAPLWPLADFLASPAYYMGTTAP